MDTKVHWSVRVLCFLLLFSHGTIAAAEETYATATGDLVTTFDVFQDCEVCPEMIVLPQGAFLMGSSAEEAIAAYRRYLGNGEVDTPAFDEKVRLSFLGLGIDPDLPEEGLRRFYANRNIAQEDDPQYYLIPTLHEFPPHTVAIDLPIAMGRNEVTREEWAACVEDGGCEQGQVDLPASEYISCTKAPDCIPNPETRIRFRLQHASYSTHPRSPMTGLTYHEMNDYTTWINSKIGANVYRIPTEAEWEYAARSGTRTRYAQGDTLTLEQANISLFRYNFVDGTNVREYDLENARELLPVDALDAANNWGLRHMSGNASELTSTCGEGPHRGLLTSRQYLAADVDRFDCRRSLKGGMYSGTIELARPAHRISIPSEHWSPSIGFRVVRDLATSH